MKTEMTTFRVHTSQTAPAPSKAILEELERQVGFVPNLAASMAESPTLLEGFTTLRRIVGSGTLAPIEREVVALTVSLANHCTYCMAAHSTFASLQGASQELLRSLREDVATGDQRLEALRCFTRTVVATRGPLQAEAVAAFQRAGFSPAQALEVLAVIAMTTIANHAHHVTAAPVDAAFAQQTWPAQA